MKIKDSNFIKTFIYPNIFILVLLIIFELLSVLIKLELPRLIQNFIDFLVLENIIGLKLLILYLILSLSFLIIELVLKNLSCILSWNIVSSIRNKLVSKIIYYDNNFYHTTNIGELLLVFNDDIKTIQIFIEKTLLHIFSSILTVIGIIIVLSKENIFIGLILTVYIVISFLIRNKIIYLMSVKLNQIFHSYQ